MAMTSSPSFSVVRVATESRLDMILLTLGMPELKHKFHLTVNVEYLFYLQLRMDFREGTDMISIGLLGAGRIGQIHGRNIAHSARARLAAIADPMPNGAKSLSEATGAPIRTPDEILADKSIDAILIGTPTDTHADFIDRAAKAGKAVFCEKPVDLSAARIRKTLERVEKAGIPLMIGFNRRFDPNFATLQRRLADGTRARELSPSVARPPAAGPGTSVRAASSAT